MRGHLILTFAVAAAIVVVATGVAAAFDLGMQAPLKPVSVVPPNVPDPARQGGDTIATAFVIPGLPFTDEGTTLGYHDDYDEACPYGGSDSPDVVYVYESPGFGQLTTVDLCGSGYDTKVYVYDGDQNLVACNDDFYFEEPCGMYVSKLDVALPAGTYAIVIDGYGGDYGWYELVVYDEAPPCVVDCPPAYGDEAEPFLVPEYLDTYNGGCDTDVVNPMLQEVPAELDGAAGVCGVTGWYTFDGAIRRDTDWYLLLMGSGGTIDVLADAEFATQVCEVGPQDCEAVSILQTLEAGPCIESTMAIMGYGYWAPVWVVVTTAQYDPPPVDPYDYHYIVWFDGLATLVAAEPTSWSTLKTLYR